MKIRIKSKEVEIEYEESTPENGYMFMSGKNSGGDDRFFEIWTKAIQQLIDGVDQISKP